MYQEQRDGKNVLISIGTVDGRTSFNPDDMNREARKYREWVKQGNTPVPDPDVLANVKVAKRREFIIEAVTRIKAQVPEWDTYEKIRLVVQLFQDGLLRAAGVTAEHTKAKDIYVFVKGTAIPDVNSKTTVADVQAMDAATYTGWPT